MGLAYLCCTSAWRCTLPAGTRLWGEAYSTEGMDGQRSSITPGFENVRDRRIVHSIREQAVCSLTFARSCFGDSRQPDGCAVRSEGLPARQESGETLYHVTPIENHSSKEGSIKTWIALLLNCRLSEIISCIDRTFKIARSPSSFQFTKPHPRGRPCTTAPEIPTTISVSRLLLGYISKALADTAQKEIDQSDRWCTTADDLIARKAVCATTSLDPYTSTYKNING